MTLAPPPLRILIVDDEDLARVRLRMLAQACTDPPASVVGEAAHGAQARTWLQSHRCDVVLLDIHMPGLDGTQLAADLRLQEDAPAVVFVTAHPQHAVQAFELEAVDYLTKPVRQERLQAALARVQERLRARSRTQEDPDAPVIVVNDRGRVTRVPVHEVLYFKAELKYVTMRTAAHSYVLDDTLADLEDRLGEAFLRVHRNALVARRSVRALERRTLAGADDEGAEGWAVRIHPVDEWLSVSRRQVTAVREALAQARR